MNEVGGIHYVTAIRRTRKKITGGYGIKRSAATVPIGVHMFPPIHKLPPTRPFVTHFTATGQSL